MRTKLLRAAASLPRLRRHFVAKAAPHFVAKAAPPIRCQGCAAASLPRLRRRIVAKVAPPLRCQGCLILPNGARFRFETQKIFLVGTSARCWNEVYTAGGLAKTGHTFRIKQYTPHSMFYCFGRPCSNAEENGTNKRKTIIVSAKAMATRQMRVHMYIQATIYIQAAVHIQSEGYYLNGLGKCFIAPFLSPPPPPPPPKKKRNKVGYQKIS